jgi:DNA-binding GntR family transcriptional regulator
LQRLAKTADAPSGKSTAWEAELAFHSALVELADCAALLENYMRVMNLVLFQQSALLTPYSFNRGDSHVQLIEDLGRLDVDAAEARMRKHIRIGKEQILQPTQRAKKN